MMVDRSMGTVLGFPAVSASKVYDAFGNVTASSGTFLGPFSYGGRFGYQEEPTGLKLLGHRLYDSSTGRFLTRDPIKDGRNWYTYCDSDPIVRADQNGNYWETVFDIVGVVLGLLDYATQPSWDSGLGLFFDLGSLALPVPDVAAIRHVGDAGVVARVAKDIERHHVFCQVFSRKIRERFDHPLFHVTVPVPKDIHTGVGGWHGYRGGDFNRLVEEGD